MKQKNIYRYLTEMMSFRYYNGSISLHLISKALLIFIQLVKPGKTETTKWATGTH